jgi:hypothetical protein
MSSAAASEPRSPWPRVLLVLWFAWLIALIAMSAHEWGRPRSLPKHPPVEAGR